jgi:hypothetical protein
LQKKLHHDEGGKKMSIISDIVFYTIYEAKDPKECIFQLCHLCGAQVIKWIRYLEEKERWFPEIEMMISENFEPEVTIETLRWEDLKILKENVTIEEVIEYYDNEKCLQISLGNCSMSDRVYNITARIPEEFRKSDFYDFIPGSIGMFILIGYYDLFWLSSDFSGYGKAYNFGNFVYYIVRKVFCSIHFQGYGIPVNIKRYEEIFFRCQKFRRLKRNWRQFLDQCGALCSLTSRSFSS